MINDSKSFKNNRKREAKEQLNYWRFNLRSGFLRLMERLTLGFNISDILAGDLGQIQHLGQVREQVKVRRLIQNATVQLIRSESSYASVEASVPQFIFKIHNARVDTLTGVVFLDAGFVVDSTLSKWQKIIYRGGIGSSARRAKRAKKKIAGTFMVMPHSPYYYHSVIDELPNLIRIRNENPECNNVLINKLAPNWVIELLIYFNFSVQTTSDKALIVENVLAISAPRTVIKSNLECLRQGLVTKPENILIVSRKGTPRNNDVMEQNIFESIPGSKLIDPGRLSVEEQIMLFSTAKIIIGLHGGGLTNCVWMDKDSTVIEIFNHAYRTSDYERLCIELGIKYQAIEISNFDNTEVVSSVRRLLHDI